MVDVAPAMATLARQMAECFAPRRRESLSAWCEREVYLPLQTGPNPRVDFDRYPYARGIVDAADDPEVEEIVMKMATQVGKTTVLQLILAALAVLRPSPAMLVAPDSIAVKKLRDKIYGLCDATQALRHLVPPRHLRNMSEIDFGNCICHLAWTGNPQRVSAESCRVVCVTEVDRSRHATREGAMEKLVGERTKSWHRSLKLFEGTPTDQDSAISDLYESSDKRTFLVPCPHCGHRQMLRFFVQTDGPYKGCGGVGGIKGDDGQWVSTDQAIQEAYYVCEHGCRIDQRDKDAAVRRGVWCPEGCSVDGDGNVVGTPARSPRRAGFGNLCSLYSPTVTIGQMAAEFFDSKGDEAKFQNFLNNWCGVRYTPRTKTPKSYNLWQRLRGPHARGTVPTLALFLTAAADVHDSDVRWIVRAWGEGASSWLVDWGFVPVQVDADGKVVLGSQLAPLRAAVLERDWLVNGENPLGQKSLRVARLAIDCGHEPLMVHNWARQFHSERVLTVAGDANPKPGVPWSFGLVEANERTGKRYPGGLRRWAINTDWFKQDLHDRWSAPLEGAGAWLVTSADWDEARSYMEEVANEGVITKHNKAGYPIRQWVMLRKGIGNHYLDCETYARAMADMVVGGVWDNLKERFSQATRQQRRPVDGDGDGGRKGFVRRPGRGFGRHSG